MLVLTAYSATLRISRFHQARTFLMICLMERNVLPDVRAGRGAGSSLMPYANI